MRRTILHEPLKWSEHRWHFYSFPARLPGIVSLLWKMTLWQQATDCKASWHGPPLLFVSAWAEHHQRCQTAGHELSVLKHHLYQHLSAIFGAKCLREEGYFLTVWIFGGISNGGWLSPRDEHQLSWLRVTNTFVTVLPTLNKLILRASESVLPTSFFFPGVSSGMFESLQAIRKTNLIDFQFCLSHHCCCNIAKTSWISLRLFRGQTLSLCDRELSCNVWGQVTLSCGFYCSRTLGHQDWGKYWGISIITE